MSAQPNEELDDYGYEGLVPIGGQDAGEKGPFFVFNPGMPKYGLREAGFEFDTLESGIISPLTDHKTRMDAEEANGQGRVFKVAGTDGKVAVITIPAWDKARYLREMYNDEGLITLRSLTGRKPSEVNLSLLNSLIRPQSLWPQDIERFTEVDEAKARRIQERIGAEGANKLLIEMAEGARRVVSEREFRGKHNGLTELYRDVIATVIAAINQFDAFANRYLNRQDGLMRRNPPGKPEYDERDRFYQYMTGRKPIDDAVTRALGQGAAGLTAGQLSEILQSVVGSTERRDADQIQCENCGTRVNLLADGRAPKICLGCREPLSQAEAKPENFGQKMARAKAEKKEGFDKEKPMGDEG